MTTRKTIVLGASTNPERYSYLAINRLSAKGYPVVAVGLREGKAGNVDVVKGLPEEKDIDTVTLYLNQQNQKAYYDYILSLHPRRIIFNPGAENNELESLANKNGIETMQACTLVLLATGQY